VSKLAWFTEISTFESVAWGALPAFCRPTRAARGRSCGWLERLTAIYRKAMGNGKTPQDRLAAGGLSVCVNTVNCIKASSARDHETTYQEILKKLKTGNLIHADETKVVIKGVDRYVWVFTNLENVAFVYGDTREVKTPQEVLRDFRGFLVSDFYTAYDNLDCAQQKCLIHLMRDINEDLRKQPFNDEMKHIAHNFATCLKPIVETIDRFGLKTRYLRKHRRSVDRLYDALGRRDYQTEVAVGYRRRFEKYRDRLFTFLGYDGIPWNNNNAEHAIKAFARLRNVIGSKSTAKGMRDYLVLLSVAETCKYKGLNFLSFLRSGEVDMQAFANSRAWRR
jgi:transposase IS66 family protein